MSDDERQIGDADLTDITHGDQVRARALRKALQNLSKSEQAGPVLREMAGEVLSGRTGLREAMRNGAYAEALGERLSEARRKFEQLPPEELEAQKEAARSFLDAQREEIEAERRERGRGPGGTPGPGHRPRHSGDDWRL